MKDDKGSKSESIEAYTPEFEPYGRVEKVQCITDWESRKQFYKPENLSK